MKFFGQTLKDFSVIKQHDGRYRISAPIRLRNDAKIVAHSIRYFNPENN